MLSVFLFVFILVSTAWKRQVDSHSLALRAGGSTGMVCEPSLCGWSVRLKGHERGFWVRSDGGVCRCLTRFFCVVCCSSWLADIHYAFAVKYCSTAPGSFVEAHVKTRDSTPSEACFRMFVWLYVSACVRICVGVLCACACMFLFAYVWERERKSICINLVRALGGSRRLCWRKGERGKA